MLTVYVYKLIILPLMTLSFSNISIDYCLVGMCIIGANSNSSIFFVKNILIRIKVN